MTSCWRATTDKETPAKQHCDGRCDANRFATSAVIPIFHVHGDVDETVPLEDNAGKLAKRYETLGGNVQLKIRNGLGHEEAIAFMECPELLTFFLADGV